MGGGNVHIQSGFEDDDAPTEGSRMYAIIVCVFASLGGIFFGYDQGVTGGVLVMNSFLKDFCVGYGNNSLDDCKKDADKLPGNWLNFTTWYSTTYNVGCIFGALLGGYVADKLGRRVTVFNAGLFFCIGTSWVCFTPAHNHACVLVARFVQGMGVGNSSFSLPLFGAEMAPKELRGLLSGFMQMTVVTGLFLANIMNNIIKHAHNGWRITNFIAVVAPVVVMAGIFCVPESPRWTYLHKGADAAETELKRLRQTDNVHHELKAIGDQIEAEGCESSWKDVLVPTIWRRVLIAMGLQVLQQATGINPVFSYGGMIFEDVIGDGVLAGLILSAVNFFSTIPAMRWVDTTGRRKLLLIGAVGMCIGHLVCAIAFTAGCSSHDNKTHCGTFAGWLMIVATCFFIFNFAISWGPVCWIYPSEIFPLNVRARAVSLSTMANWVMGVAMTFVPKLFPSLHINGVFFLFAALSVVCGVFVYYMCPETKGMLLEDIEALFNKTAQLSPKYVGAQTPAGDAMA